MTTTNVKFLNKDKSTFFPVLRTRIEQYFQENAICKSGGSPMVGKAIFMLSLYLVPYILILTNLFPAWAMLILSGIMGIGIAGVGMSVMHDANHGSFSTSPWVNTLFSGSLYLLGGNVYNWKVQHNTLHHTYTNIDQLDSDITGKPFLRLCDQQRLQKMHRYQHIYAFLLYGLMTFSFLVKDFKQIGEFNRKSKSKLTKPFSSREILILLAGKLFYVVFVGVLPLALTDITFGQWALGFLLMNFVAGFVLSVIFQLAHIIEEVHSPIRNDQGNIENAWAIHQLESTANFAVSRPLSWFIGGLNYQIEHHLFPSIGHVHYPAIAPIVQATAQEFGLPYYQKTSLMDALGSHVNMLKNLGRPQAGQIVSAQRVVCVPQPVASSQEV
ncbi:fatty acid desaturase family protein [Larkinella punicea]|uniref:Acyl-CoA desaturase n=1 Tax=Larkinella punicea TaxID=2315727 RepID=A0A368JME3_9BACT|nr:acyl-CoA desaturase [Larkinella punicea]RCR68216.1 acyl-CoA desaturase [Larkinella punicea]